MATLLERRGRVYDCILAAIKDYAQTEDPHLSIQDAVEITEQFPAFLSHLEGNLRGELARDLPDLPGDAACADERRRIQALP